MSRRNTLLLALVCTVASLRSERVVAQQLTGMRAGVATFSASPLPSWPAGADTRSAGTYLPARLASVEQGQRSRHSLIGALVGATVAAGTFWIVEASHQHVCNFDSGTGDCGFMFPIEIAVVGIGGGIVGGLTGWFWPIAGER